MKVTNETYPEEAVWVWDVLSGVAKMAWDVMSGVTKMAWDVMSGVTKTAWDVLSGLANLCGMFCPGFKKMAWDVLSRDVLSGSRHCHLLITLCKQFGPRSGPTFCPGLIGVQTV